MKQVIDEGRRVVESLDTIPVFPLPGVVFFPHALLPLHIFEARYREMTADALASSRLIAVALSRPDAVGGEEGATVGPIACAGVIEAAARLPDGRYLLRLRGIARLEVLRWTREEPYRIARFRRLLDRNEADGADVAEDKHRLLALCAGLRQEVADAPGQGAPLDEDIPFASAVNTLCQTLNMDAALKYRLLELDDVRDRCRMLIQLLTKRWEEIAGARSAGGRESGNDVH